MVRRRRLLPLSALRYVNPVQIGSSLLYDPFQSIRPAAELDCSDLDLPPRVISDVYCKRFITDTQLRSCGSARSSHPQYDLAILLRVAIDGVSRPFCRT